MYMYYLQYIIIMKEAMSSYEGTQLLRTFRSIYVYKTTQHNLHHIHIHSNALDYTSTDARTFVLLYIQK